MHCPYAGRALNAVQVAHPTRITYLQYHGGDSWATALTSTRQSFYTPFQGYPTVWFDGTSKCVGSYDNDAQQLNWYTTNYNSRVSIPTDVSIQLSASTNGDPNGAGPWHVKATVQIDPAGVGKTVRLYLIHALDNYPYTGYTDHRDRMCVRPPLPAYPYYNELTLVPGVPQSLTMDFTFDSTSMTYRNDIKIVAFAQSTNATGPAEIYNAAVMSWPFPPSILRGDLNCDGEVDFDDINPFVLALSDPAGYAIAYPNCNILTGDINQDGLVNFEDINPFVALLSNPPGE